MSKDSQHLIEDIIQQLRLPDINADACVHSVCNLSNCRSCVDACPQEAWILDDEALGLNVDTCDGCGLCVPACPSGALHIHFPWVIRQLGAKIVALFACDKSGINEHSAILPCIHALGIRQLLQLYNSGIEHLLLATEQCKQCSRYASNNDLYYRIEKLNHLLSENNQSPIILMQRSNNVWTKVFNSDETISRGTQISRRDFLHGGGQQLHKQMLIIDPLNQAELQTIPPGQFLTISKENKSHWPWSPVLDEFICNGCDACINLCPTGALKLFNSEKNLSNMYELSSAQLKYEINPQDCTGCGICAAVCESEAIMIDNWFLSSYHFVPLTESTCNSCGIKFHFPKQYSQSDRFYCRICQHQDHNSNLYQVLD